jgi:hypothetical protein
MSKKTEIMDQLDELGVEYDSKLKTKELKKLLEECEHVVTEEDLEQNPEFLKEDIQVGDVIYLPREDTTMDTALGASDQADTSDEKVKPKDKVIGTFALSSKEIKDIYYVAEVKDANNKSCMQIQCLDGHHYRVSLEESDKRLKLKK